MSRTPSSHKIQTPKPQKPSRNHGRFQAKRTASLAKSSAVSRIPSPQTGRAGVDRRGPHPKVSQASTPGRKSKSSAKAWHFPTVVSPTVTRASRADQQNRRLLHKVFGWAASPPAEAGKAENQEVLPELPEIPVTFLLLCRAPFRNIQMFTTSGSKFTGVVPLRGTPDTPPRVRKRFTLSCRTFRAEFSDFLRPVRKRTNNNACVRTREKGASSRMSHLNSENL